MSLQYRPEIDGLRALAVLPVIFFHAGFSLFSGGFIGVDIFFVISGYLITSLILKEISEERFRITNFYARRARRILPALFFVILICIPFAVFWLSPQDLRDFGQSLFAVALFISNYLFWYESGYFETASELKPLLHTWSLAVEEQYYILFPIFMVLIWKLRKIHILIIFSLLFLSSLLFAHWSAYNFSSFGFFSLLSRGWELILGVFCAYYLFYKKNPTNPKFDQFLSIAGLLLIILSIFLFNERTPFPSLYTLIPTIGVVMIILSTNRKVILNKILSSKVFVGIGLISYSAYLWHQPILAFARHRSYNELSFTLLIFLIFLALFLAFLSWYFVEKPFRDLNRITNRQVYFFSISGILLISLFGLYLYFFTKDIDTVQTSKFNLNLPTKYMGIEIEGKNCSFPKLNQGESSRGEDVCVLKGNNNISDSNYLIVGDSHARVLSEAFYNNIDQYSSLTDLTASGCPFLIDLNIFLRNEKTECDTKYQNLRKNYILNNKNKNIIYQARLPLYLYGSGFDNGVGGIEFIRETFASKSIEDNYAVRKQNFYNSLNFTLQFLAQNSKNTFVILPTMTNGWDPVKRVKKISKFNDDFKYIYDQLKIPFKHVNQRHSEIDDHIISLSKKFKNIFIIDPKKITCNTLNCNSVGKDGNLYFTDPDHLSLYTNNLIYNEISSIAFEN